MIQPGGEENNAMFGELLTGWQALLDSNLDLCETTTAARQGGERRKLAEETTSSTANLSSDIFSPYMLIPEGSTYYFYDGGLTTPPCSEVVWWNLADKSVNLNPAQFLQLIQLIIGFFEAEPPCSLGSFAGPAGSTARPPVALNDRIVDRICPVGFAEDSSEDFSVDNSD